MAGNSTTDTPSSKSTEIYETELGNAERGPGGVAESFGTASAPGNSSRPLEGAAPLSWKKGATMSPWESKVSQVWSDTREGATRWAHSAEDFASRAGTELTTWVKKNPYPALIAGAGVGWLIGMLSYRRRQ